MESRLRTGKLPPDRLRRLVLNRTGVRRTETIIGASIGVDAAAIGLGADELCVLTCDPITTATAGAGRLAVHVVCNDLAVMGAEPVGVLATLLFPAGVSEAAIAELAAEIDETARALGVEVLGGHTEVAPGLSTPLAVLTGVGKARRDRLVTAAGARPGDALVLTKAAALEGSHILATDLAPRLGGVPEALLVEARGYASELSVVPDARVALQYGATAMHDPTEAGVIGALWELAEASGVGFRVLAKRIPVREATRAICDALGVDPLRLIASGALLIACADGEVMARGLREAGIDANVIGEITREPARIVVQADGNEQRVETPERDELYRILEVIAESG